MVHVSNVSTKDLIAEHWKLIVIGTLLLFFSAFGQTVFIGVYIEDIRQSLGLSQAEISGMYTIGSIASAFVILLTGKLLDKFYEPYILYACLVLLAFGCFMLVYSQNLLVFIMLPLAFFLLRQCGQGLMTLYAQTCINRYVVEGRGRATSFIKIGAYSHAVAFPLFAVFMKQYFSWQESWLVYGVFIIVGLLPLFFFLHLDHHKRRDKHDTHMRGEEEKLASGEATAPLNEKTQMEVIKDIRFYILNAVMIVAPTFTTAIFFLQEPIAAAQEISHVVYVASFTFFTVAAIIGNLSNGFIMDRYGEEKMLLVIPVIYAIGLAGFIFFDGVVMTYAAMIFIGLATGAAGTLGGPILAKLFGVKNLGAVKSMSFAIMVFAAGLSPFIGGIMLDAGYTIEVIMSWFLAYTVVAWLVMLLSYRLFKG